jgi:hypothetical protein
MCLLMAVFAFSARVMLAQHLVLSYEGFYAAVHEPLGKIFRSPGRFIWPLHYALLAAAVAGALRLLRGHPRLAMGALLLSLCVQALEVPEDRVRGALFKPELLPLPGGTATWALATGHYRHVVLLPPVMVDGAGHGCQPDDTTFSTSESLPFAWQAWQAGMTFNSGYVARLDEPRIHAACEEAKRVLREGRVEEDTLYVVHASAAARFREDTAGRATCGSLEGVLVCVSAREPGPFQEALARAPASRRAQ